MILTSYLYDVSFWSNVPSVVSVLLYSESF
uniref:Uncharacterized protein n=1 Tax=Utricularia reniformis TaxID=192314 RepID=A0A1Y0B051_9LAMI|nr:hypothetical protein AEK19_MT0524 [Utricularia reniformis]ART30780.1 hypothetical protein AEK19_MT0524 [Utricularia reniformis]